MNNPQNTYDEQEVRAYITKYLLSNGCKSSLTGFTILQDAIMISLSDPTLSCEGIFREYSGGGEHKYDKNGKLWKASYRAARYCIQQSRIRSTGIYTFIKDCTLSIKSGDYRNAFRENPTGMMARRPAAANQ